MVAQSLHVKLYPTQDDFVADDRRYTAFIGGRNSGKTYSGSVKALLLATQGGLGCIAAPSFPMLEHGAKVQFLDRLDESGIPYTKARDGVTIPAWNAEVLFVTLESESRVRGPNFHWGWADEVEYVADRKIWQALKGAVRAGDNPQLFVTSTPKGRKLVWDEWVVNKTAAHAMYKATTFDNIFVDAADYVAGLGYEGVFYEQEITADFVTFEGLVYPGFDRTTHVRTVDCDGWATVLGLDVGTRNPTSLSTYRYAGDRLHKERELYQREMDAEQIIDATEAEYKRSRASHVVIDPSAAGLSKSLMRRGVRVRPGINDVLIGISRVASILPNLTIDPSCTFTLAEFESYAYPDGTKGRPEKDVPVKANDHAMDELRYVVLDLYGKPSNRIRGIR
jgi:phage terminase large subunit